MGRSKTYLVAIALAVGLTGAQAQTAPVRHIPPGPQGSLGPKGVFTSARQKWLFEVVTAKGKMFDLGPHIAAGLGLTSGDGALVIATNSGGIYHEFATLSDGGVLLTLIDTAKARNYRLDAHLRLVAAITAVDNEPTPIPISDAQSVVEGELVYWADMADQLQALPDDQR